MKNILIVFLLLAGIAHQLDAQARYFDERYIFTQAHLYPVLINPAATGEGQDHTILLNYRNNWASFEGSPKTFTLSYDGMVADRVGFGGLLLTDTYGELETTKGQLSFSYTVPSENNRVAFGLSTEFIQHNISGSAIANILNNSSDPVLLNRLDGRNFFDISFGVHGLYENKISYGLVLPGLVNSSLDQNDTGENEFGYILNFGYKLSSEKNDIVAHPSIFIKQLGGVPTHIDLNIALGFLEEKFTGGLTYTIGADERLGFLVGVKVNTLNFLYSYNISRHGFQEFNNGAHELMLVFNIFGNKNESNQTNNTRTGL